MITLNATVFFCTVNLLKHDDDAILQFEYKKRYDAIYEQRITKWKHADSIFLWTKKELHRCTYNAQHVYAR